MVSMILSVSRVIPSLVLDEDMRLRIDIREDPQLKEKDPHPIPRIS
jgi:hypothetical protein